MRFLSIFALLLAFVFVADSDARGRKGKRASKKAAPATVMPLAQPIKQAPKKVEPGAVRPEVVPEPKKLDD